MVISMMTLKYVKLEKQLTREYEKAFDKVRCYGEGHQYSPRIMGEKMMDLVDLMLQAQKDQRPCEEIVGNDIDAFCQEYFSDYDSKDWLLDTCRWMAIVFCCVFVWETGHFLKLLLVEHQAVWAIKTNLCYHVIPDILGYTVATVVWYILKVGVLPRHQLSIKKYTVSAWMLYTFFIVIINRLFTATTIEFYSLPVVVLLGVYIVAYFAAIFIYRYVKTGSFKSVY